MIDAHAADPVTDWDAFFDPRTVCVVGASTDPNRIGGRLVRYSLESGFSGRILPVNPNRSEVQGLRAVPSLSKVDTAPDWVVLAIGSEGVLDAVREAGRIGAKFVSIVAAGFAETGPTGEELQRHVAAEARAAGMRLLGPNANGFMNVATDAFFAFTPVIDSARPTPGEISVVTQSAAIGTYLVNWSRTMGLGLHHWIHTGNESDITLLEVTRKLIEERRSRVIALSYELLRDGEELREVLQLAADADVSLSVLQTGLSVTGRRAAEAHTAALVEDDAGVVAGLLADAGVHVAPSIAEMADFLQVAVNHPGIRAAPRLGIVSTSGGIGILTADAADAAGVEMPTLSDGLQGRLREIAPFCHPANPIDTTAQVINEPNKFRELLATCIATDELDIFAAFVAHGLAGHKDVTLTQILDVVATSGADVTTATAILGLLTPGASLEAQQAGVSVFREPIDLVRAFGAFSEARQRRAAFLADHTSDTTVAPSIIPMPMDPTIGFLDEVDAKRRLAELGAPVVVGSTVDCFDAAALAADRIGFPVVMKVASDRIPHKAASGAIAVGICSEAELREAFERLSVVRSRLPKGDASRARILVEAMAPGREFFVGAIRHPAHGWIVGVGLGGADVEHRRQVTWSWPSLGIDRIEPILSRWAPDIASAAAESIDQIVRSVTRLATESQRRVAVVECNPVMIDADGCALIVDALVEFERADGSTHLDGDDE